MVCRVDVPWSLSCHEEERRPFGEMGEVGEDILNMDGKAWIWERFYRVCNWGVIRYERYVARV